MRNSLLLSSVCVIFSAAWEFGDAGGAGLVANVFPLYPPGAVAGLPPVTTIASAHSANCAVAKGEVYCWGRCDEGLCGPQSSVAQPQPRKVPGLTDVVSISLYGSLGCAVHQDRTVSCWGRAPFAYPHVLGGKSGLGPEQIAGLANVTKVSLGATFACALLAHGHVYCWGKNGSGELGLGRALKLGRLWEDGQPRIDFVGLDCNTPRQLPGLSNIVDLACESSRCCALSAAGAVTCWGEADYYQQVNQKTHLWRDGSQHRIRLPDKAIAISTSNNGESCAVLRSGSVACWEYSLEQPYSAIKPQVCTSIRGADRFLADRSAVVQTSDGRFVSCGLDTEQGMARVAGLPSGLPTLELVTGRAENGCGRTAVGVVFCWGYNDFAQLARPANPSDRSQLMIEKERAEP